MNRAFIDDDAEAIRIAKLYEVYDSMVEESNRRLPDSIAAGTGLAIGCKRAALIPKERIKTGPFEFVFITYMAGFIEGENGWAVVRWWNVAWDELPELARQIDQVEKELLPLAVGADRATPKFEAYMKAKEKKDNPPDNLTGQG